jgi:hypothetical protein
MMADEPDHIIPVMLGDIHATQNEHSTHFEQIEMPPTDIENQRHDDKPIVGYSPGQSSETQARRAQPESRIEEFFDKLEKRLCDKMPV